MGEKAGAIVAGVVLGAATGGLGAVAYAGFAGAGFASVTTSAILSGAAMGAIGGGLNAAAAVLTSRQSSSADLGLLTRDRTVNVRQPLAPRRIIYGRVRVGGPIVYVESTDNNATLHFIVALASHEVDAIETVWFDDEALTLDGTGAVTAPERYVGKATVERFTGAPGQAAAAKLVEASDDKWTAAHRGDGVAYLYVRLTWDPNVWSGIPNVTAIVRGAKVLDPRTGTTAWSRNAALCIRDYLTRSTRAGGVGATAAELDTTAWNAAANVCDEAVALAAGGTEARYTLDGTVELTASNTPRQTLERMLTACAGSLVYAGGRWRLLPGVWRTPTVTLTEDDLRAQLSVQTAISRRNRFNALKGTFVDPASNWQATDYPPVLGATTNDAGERVWREKELAYTTSATAAQRLARIDLRRAVAGAMTVQFPAKLTAMRLQTGDVVQLTITRLGWSAKAFEVVEWRLAVYQDGDAPALGVDLVLRETVSTIYDWTSTDEAAFQPAPRTTLPSAFAVPAPGAPAVAEELYETRAGAGVGSRLVVTWGAVADAFVQDYAVRFRAVGAATWTVLAVVRDTRQTIDDLATGSYEVQVRAVNVLGTVSAWSATTVREVVGLAARPADVTNLSLTVRLSQAHLRWDRHPDLDVRIGGRIRIRHSTLTSGATWEGSTELLPGNEPGVAGSSSAATVPLLAGTYLLKAEDSAGNTSATAAAVSTTAPDLFAYSTPATVNEHPSFAGTKTNCTVSAGVLTLDAGQSSGTYVFANRIDLGAVFACRLSVDVRASVVTAGLTVDSRPGDVDSWDDWDGTVVGVEAGARVEVRTTPDDPAGSPTWSAWAPLVIGDYSARGFEFRIQLTTADTAYQVQVTQASASAAVASRTEDGSAVSGTLADTTVTFGSRFYSAPRIQLTPVGAAAGDYVDLVSRSATQFVFNIRNSAGTRIARTVDWTATGYGR